MLGIPDVQRAEIRASVRLAARGELLKNVPFAA
jgi:hypothetical protein